jgi:hypothetical protein
MSDMHPLLLMQRFEDWALDKVGGKRGALIFAIGFFPIVLVSLLTCLIPSYVVLIREEGRKRRRHG